jgi:hypothetical protein
LGGSHADHTKDPNAMTHRLNIGPAPLPGVQPSSQPLDDRGEARYWTRHSRKRNPEADVIDAIDELVNEQLTHRQDDYNERWSETCQLCGGQWHGLPGDADNGGGPGCPGAYATEDQANQWRQQDNVRRGRNRKTTPLRRNRRRIMPDGTNMVPTCSGYGPPPTTKAGPFDDLRGGFSMRLWLHGFDPNRASR